ncbi:hypothetical protein [Mycolicibacterium phocaicum]|uniref:Uncharacterized protein n=1 Tax=Mycolicibacterium phocaicum TaxID=319706 RepID=A0AA94R9B5_9MYCO|nr:hypothetical protein [Mycolicibacterium phocaicum]TLH63711.1 hypothetical protein C1S79_21345 [Mycolicibacterium phocaicum]
MRYDILNVSAPAHRVEHLLKAALGATDEPNKFGSKSHLKTPDGGRIRVSASFTDGSKSTVSLHSDFDNAEHNAWAVKVFNTTCAATDADVDLFDEADSVVKSRHRNAA